MPRPIATDTTKAIETRPILLNFMRFLNLAGSQFRPPSREQLCRDTNPSLIVEGEATLCHFRAMENLSRPANRRSTRRFHYLQMRKPKPEPGPSRLYPFLVLPDAAGVCRHHRLTDFASEGLAELFEVLHASVGAPLAARVRISLGQIGRASC